jgi:hypothetical protein
MRRTFLQALMLIGLVSVVPAAQAQNYGQELNSQWKSILGIQRQDGPYQWFGYPVDNFGVITTYGPPSGRHLEDSDRVCATWSCIGVNASQIPADIVNFTTVNGYADSGQGPTIHLTNKSQGKAAISLLLSNLFDALTLDASANLSKGVTVDLAADGVYKRSVNMQKFQDYINTRPSNDLIKVMWNSGQLTYIGADIVAHNIKITLTIDVERNASINAKLSQALGKLGSGSTAGITLSSSGTGQYVVQYPGFVVLATQLHHQFKPGELFNSGSGVSEEQQKFLASTSSVPKPKVDPKTLQVTAGKAK